MNYSDFETSQPSPFQHIAPNQQNPFQGYLDDFQDSVQEKFRADIQASNFVDTKAEITALIQSGNLDQRIEATADHMQLESDLRLLEHLDSQDGGNRLGYMLKLLQRCQQLQRQVWESD